MMLESKYWRHSGNGFVGKGCVGQLCSPGTVETGYWSFFYWKNRFTCFPVEHKDESLFGYLCNSIDCFSVFFMVTRFGGDGRSKSQMS
jgi:hypothetical protein